GVMHLVPFGIKHEPCSKYFEMISVVSWLTNISCFIDQFIPIKSASRFGSGAFWRAAGLLGADCLVASQDEDDEKEKCDSLSHSVVLHACAPLNFPHRQSYSQVENESIGHWYIRSLKKEDADNALV